MKVYYAHSMRIYGTLREREEIRCLRLKLHRVTNPNGLLDGGNWQAKARRLIRLCDAVVVSEHRGHIGKGVHTEIEMASEMGKQIYVLRDWELRPITVNDVTIVDRHDWQVRYAKVA